MPAKTGRLEGGRRNKSAEQDVDRVRISEIDREISRKKVVSEQTCGENDASIENRQDIHDEKKIIGRHVPR